MAAQRAGTWRAALGRAGAAPPLRRPRGATTVASGGAAAAAGAGFRRAGFGRTSHLAGSVKPHAGHIFVPGMHAAEPARSLAGFVLRCALA